MQEPRETPVIAQQIAVLSESASALARRGQHDDAAKVYEKILEIAPYNEPALGFLTTRAFESNDTDRCLALLERAIQARPERPRTYLNLAMVYKARTDFPAALQAVDKALQLKPVFPNALLQKGAILEDMGQEAEALRAYALALKQAPGLLQPEQLPAHMRRYAMRGNELVTLAKLKLLDAALNPLRAGHAADELRRIEEFADIYAGRQAPRYLHAAQRPGFLYFPNLDPLPFYESSAFPWFRALETATDEIRSELLAVMQEPSILKPYVDIDAADAAQWTELNKSLQWSAFHLYKAGERIEENCRRCPATATAIERLPLPRTPGHSPEVFFSILKPGTHIPPHFGLGNYKLAVHLPLVVPGDCAIRVGNEIRGWEAGRCLVFDDSFKHEAWNKSDEARAVLILDVWNPQLTELERDAVVALLNVAHELEALGGG